MKSKQLTLIINIHNNETKIEQRFKDIIIFFKKLIQEELISENSRILAIDNASKDASWYEITKQNVRYPNLINGIKLKKQIAYKNLDKLSEKTDNLTILVNLDFNDEEILNIIKEKPSGLHCIKQSNKCSLLENIKSCFLTKKIQIEEKI